MGHRDWPKLNVLKADYCEARGLDPALTVLELHRPDGVWAVKGHMVIAKPLVGLGFDVEAAVIDGPCGCPEVADITEEMLDEALKGARLKRLLGMYDCKIPEGEVGLRGEMFVVAWSTEDGEWLATAAGKESLSWLAGTPVEALAGLVKVLEEEVLYDGA